MTSGLYITVIYAAAHLLISLGVAIAIYMSTDGQLKFRKFAYRVWKLRAVFTPLIIHIYDTSTDIGVLYEWYFLAQDEKNGDNIESLDMEQLFWTAIGFMIAYRFLLGCFGVYYAFADDWFDKYFYWDRNSICECFGTFCAYLARFIVGFVGAALELGIFLSIYREQTDTIEEMKERIKKRREKAQKRKNRGKNQSKNKKNDEEIKDGDGNDNDDSDDGDEEYCAGDGQKLFQFSEGVLESLPEAIMQSVFLIRSRNDPNLSNNNDIFFILLLYLSICASILSIANKYIWLDRGMIDFYGESFVMSKQSIVESVVNYRLVNTSKEFITDPETLIALKKTGDKCSDAFSIVEYGGVQFCISRYCYEVSQIVERLIKRLFVDYYEMSKQQRKQKHTESPESPTNKNVRAVLTALLESQIIDTEFRLSLDEITFIGMISEREHDKNQLMSLQNTCVELVLIILTSKENEETVKQLLWQIEQDEYDVHWTVKPLCGNNKYYICYGFIVRVMWRIAAVTSRFVIISLIWVVLGGAFEVVIIPIMIIFWYLVVGCFANVYYRKMKHQFEHKMTEYKEEQLSVMITSAPDNGNGVSACGWCGRKIKQKLTPQVTFWYCQCCPEIFGVFSLLLFWFLALVFAGIVLQLGIVFFAGMEFFTIRIIENIILMSIITWFAFDSNIASNCDFCADADTRQATYNDRIFAWIVVGWSAVISHAIASIYVSKMVNKTALTIESLTTFDEDEEHEQKLKRARNERKKKKFNLVPKSPSDSDNDVESVPEVKGVSRDNSNDTPGPAAVSDIQ